MRVLLRFTRGVSDAARFRHRLHDTLGGALRERVYRQHRPTQTFAWFDRPAMTPAQIEEACLRGRRIWCCTAAAVRDPVPYLVEKSLSIVEGRFRRRRTSVRVVQHRQVYGALPGTRRRRRRQHAGDRFVHHRPVRDRSCECHQRRGAPREAGLLVLSARVAGASCPVIVRTALRDDETNRQVATLGEHVQLLHKPFSVAELQSALSESIATVWRSSEQARH